MSVWIKTILAFPGVHFVLTRFGSSRLRAASFDHKFNRGDWNFALDQSAELVSVVEQYVHKGHILMLGCGSASLAGALAPEAFAGFIGIDISPQAIKRASLYANEKVCFSVADCTHYDCERAYDVVLFSESLYYISPLRRKSLLNRLSAKLTSDGVIIVTISDPRRYAGILRLVRRNFSVTEDRPFQSSKRHLLVFR